jgi:predicted MFS family arabinose efflux permease
MRLTDERRWTRRAIGGGCMLLAAAALAGVYYSESFLTATACNAAALFLLQLSIPSWWAVVAEISGRHGASMFGLMNSLGGLGVMVMTYLVGRVVQARQAAEMPPLECWQPVFNGVAIALAFGACCWLFVDAKRSIVGHDPPGELPLGEMN